MTSHGWNQVVMIATDAIAPMTTALVQMPAGSRPSDATAAAG